MKREVVEGVCEFAIGVVIAGVAWGIAAPNLISCGPRSKAETRAAREREIEQARRR